MVATIIKTSVDGFRITSQQIVSRFMAVDEFTGSSNTSAPGELGWRFAGSSNVQMAFSATVGATGHPGVMGVQTGATAVGVQSLFLTNGNIATHPQIVPSDVDEFCFIFICFSPPDDTFRAGLLSHVNAEPTSGIFIERHSAESTWFAVARQSATSAQRVNTGVPYATNSWVKVIARRTDIGWEFALNNAAAVLVSAEHAPANAPLHPGIQVTKDSVGTPGFGIDFFSLTGTVSR